LPSLVRCNSLFDGSEEWSNAWALGLTYVA
jgi:hypothetical protein